MIRQSTSVILGRNPADGSPVGVSPEMGPLLIFGDFDSGKTFTAIGVFDQLATIPEDQSQRSVIAVDASEQGYTEIAQERGGYSLSLPLGGGSIEHICPDYDSSGSLMEGPRTLAIDASGLTSGTTDAPEKDAEDLSNLLLGYQSASPAPHLIVDPVDALLEHGQLADLICSSARKTRSTGALLVLVFSEPEALARIGLDTASLLQRMSFTLLLGDTANLQRNPYLSEIPAPLLAVSELSISPNGSGLLISPGGGFTTLQLGPCPQLAPEVPS